MNKSVPISKDENNQTQVPSIWRATLSEIITALVEGDFRISRHIDGVCPVSEDDASRIEKNIHGYGATLKILPDEAWDTSACQWMLSYWGVLVDLFTIEEGASDLALAVRVYEDGEKYTFDVHSVHVP